MMASISSSSCPRLADKGHALLVLVRAGALADEHYLRRAAAVAEDHIRPRFAQRALTAVLDSAFPVPPNGPP